MKRTLFVLFLLLVIAGPASAGIKDGPDHTILWNEFSAISVINGFAVGIAHEAIVVCRYDYSLSSFVPINLLFVEFEPVSFKWSDTRLMIKTHDDRIVFYDLNDLPDLRCLGTLDPGMPFADFVVKGQNIYLSRWFDGIWRFSMDGFGAADFVDSSMTGILMTQLEVYDDTLYALDEYNGIMRYDLSGSGFGHFTDYLWIPFQATSFVKTDSLVIILTKTDGVLFGEFGYPGSGIIDSIVGISNPLKTFVTDSLLVFLSYRFMDIVDREDPSQRTSIPIPESLIDGDILLLDNQHHLLLPRAEGGLTLYNLDDLDLAREGLYRSGPVSDLLLHNGKLFTAGSSNPVDVYSFDTSATPELEYTMFNGLRDVKAIDHNGDTLIVLYSQLNKIAFITNSLDPDSFFIESSFFLNDTATVDIQYISQKRDTVWPLLAIGGTSIDVYAVTDSSGVYHANTWQFVGRISEFLVHDSFLFVTTHKKQLWIHRITDSLEIEFQSVIDLAGTPTQLMVVDERLVVFVWDKMLFFDYSHPQFPELDAVITLPLPVLDAVKRENKLYTVGPDGVGIYDLSGATPELIEDGGRGGTFLDVEAHVLATSDGGAIHIYRLPVEDDQPSPDPELLPANYALYQNYPNPFNAATSIEYSLLVRSRVELVVYNLLGQQVRTLVDEEKPKGQYTAHWDGRDYAGSYVATGVYFYRVTAGDFVDSKKMVLLK